MQEILYEYHMDATTWVYLASLITIAVYFKFRRFWSVRNLDLIGLILLAPGLLLVSHGQGMNDAAGRRPVAVKTEGGGSSALGDMLLPPVVLPAPSGDQPPKAGEGKENAEERASPGRPLEQAGYLWLFIVGGFFLLRMLVDSAMVRRPLLEPNLSASGLTFTCVAMLVFLMSNVITHPPSRAADAALPKSSEKSPAKEKDAADAVHDMLKQRGPGYPPFHNFSSEPEDPVKRATAIIAHLTVVLGMVVIGYRHFDNTHTGIAAATLYLLLPYTAQYTPRIDHVVPAALLVLAIQCYRRPVVSGIFVGLAMGLIWYPLFLLPLWCSFYWRRGLLRFSLSVLVVLGILAISLAFTPASLGSYKSQFCQTFGFGLWYINPAEIRGFWEGDLAPFRYPVIAAFVALCGSMALWPAQKNLGSLLACSAAIMLGTQFWKGYEGGTFMAWYLPLLILAIFRPNLEDRVALSAISEGWVKWRK